MNWKQHGYVSHVCDCSRAISHLVPGIIFHDPRYLPNLRNSSYEWPFTFSFAPTTTTAKGTFKPLTLFRFFPTYCG